MSGNAANRADGPTVSVVIPCYRQAHFLGDAISSVLAQSRPVAEVVVVDDGSPDRPKDVVARFAGVRCISQENRGLSGARNRGLAETSGAFIVFLDADDRLLPNAIADGVAALIRCPECAFVWGFNEPIDAAGDELAWRPTHYAGVPSYERLLERNIVGAPVGVMFRRTAIQAVGGFALDSPSAEDYEMYLRLARDHRIACHGALVGQYRYHDNNLSKDMDLMLTGVLWGLEQQRTHIGVDRRLGRALRRGIRDAHQRFDGSRRIAEVSVRLREGRWLSAGLSCFGLLARYPGLLLSTGWSRFRRP